jgi:hypothetical protein
MHRFIIYHKLMSKCFEALIPRVTKCEVICNSNSANSFIALSTELSFQWNSNFGLTLSRHYKGQLWKRIVGDSKGVYLSISQILQSMYLM